MRVSEQGLGGDGRLPRGLSLVLELAGAGVVGRWLRIALFDLGWRNCEQNSISVCRECCVWSITPPLTEGA